MIYDPFLSAMEQAFKRAATTHLNWNKDDLRCLFRKRVMEAIEFEAKMFNNRREGR